MPGFVGLCVAGSDSQRVCAAKPAAAGRREGAGWGSPAAERGGTPLRTPAHSRDSVLCGHPVYGSFLFIYLHFRSQGFSGLSPGQLFLSPPRPPLRV